MINTYSKISCPLSYGENLFILFTLCPVINYGAFFLLYSFYCVVNPSVRFRSFPIDEKNRLSIGISGCSNAEDSQTWGIWFKKHLSFSGDNSLYPVGVHPRISFWTGSNVFLRFVVVLPVKEVPSVRKYAHIHHIRDERKASPRP